MRSHDSSDQRSAPPGPSTETDRGEVLQEFRSFRQFVEHCGGRLSRQGLLLEPEELRPPGTRIAFELRVDDGFRLLRGLGEVVWVRERESEAGPRGMAVRFLQLDEPSQRLLDKVLERFRLDRVPLLDLSPLPTPEPYREPEAEFPSASASPPPLRHPALPGEDLGQTGSVEDHPVADQQGPAPAEIEPEAFDGGEETLAERGAALGEGLDTSLENLLARPTDESAGLPERPGSGPRGPELWSDILEEPDDIPEPSDETFALPAAGRAMARRRSSLWLWLAALVLVVAGGGAWLFRDTLSSWMKGGAEERGESAEIATDPSPESPAPTPVGTAASLETESETPPGRGGMQVDDATSQDVGEEREQVAERSRAEPSAVGPEQAAAAVSVGSEPETLVAEDEFMAPAAVERHPLPPLTGIDRITWEREGEATVVVLWADGTVPSEGLETIRIDGQQPRELIKVLGVSRAFAPGSVAVGTSEVIQVRTGLHDEQGQKALHLVADLASPAARLDRVQVQGDRIRIYFTGG